MRIVSIIAIIVWINHMMCCGWFAIGINAPSDTGDRWVDNDFLSQVEHSKLKAPELEDLMYQYWTTFHWSLTQITLGATEVVSGNTVERIYTVICLVFGLLFGSTLVSSLSATMVEFQMLRSAPKRHPSPDSEAEAPSHNKVGTLGAEMLSSKSMPHALVCGSMKPCLYLIPVFTCCKEWQTSETAKQVKERLGPTDKLQEGDVKSLELLSHQLLSLLRREIYGGHLALHPLLNLWSGMDPNLFGKSAS
eukprot:3035901-Amphidinium_carterae.1